MRHDDQTEGIRSRIENDNIGLDSMTLMTSNLLPRV